MNSGENMGAGNWRIEVAALITDINNNPVIDGTAIWFTLPENPGWAFIDPASYVGNVNAEGDSLPGTAYTSLTYEGIHTNDSLMINVETAYCSNDTVVYLPMQYPWLDLALSPQHLDWFEDPPSPDTLFATINAQLKDGQNNPINNQKLFFTSTLGQPVDMGTDNDGSPFTEITGVIDGDGSVTKEWMFFRYECPPADEFGPGTIAGTITVNVWGTDLVNVVTIILRSYDKLK